MEAVSWNTSLRKLLYLIPVGVFVGLRIFSSFSRSARFLIFIYQHPIELLIIAITIGGVMYFLAEIMPKILRNREKKDIEILSQASSHDIAPELGVEAYYDTSFPIEAYETTKDFVSLESGWKYGEQQRFDFKTAMPEAEEAEEDENATEFEKQGQGRRMLQ